MPRIRTIKPEFWTSEQVVECSTSARLLFVGLWNFADDGGVHPASLKRLKMEVFPADPISDSEMAGMITELVDNGLLRVFESEGQSYWQVTGWRHQKIDRPSYRHPQENSTSIRRTLDEHSTNDRRALVEGHPPEGKGRETEKEGKSKPPLTPPLHGGEGKGASSKSKKPKTGRRRRAPKNPFRD